MRPSRFGSTLLITLVLAISPAFAVEDFDKVWHAWERETHRQCPSHHVDWIADGLYDELLGGFTQTLPKPTQRKIDSIADYSRRCKEEIAGFSCEMATDLDAFNKLGLLKRFTAFGCHHWTCEEESLCTSIGSDKHEIR